MLGAITTSTESKLSSSNTDGKRRHLLLPVLLYLLPISFTGCLLASSECIISPLVLEKEGVQALPCFKYKLDLESLTQISATDSRSKPNPRSISHRSNTSSGTMYHICPKNLPYPTPLLSSTLPCLPLGCRRWW